MTTTGEHEKKDFSNNTKYEEFWVLEKEITSSSLNVKEEFAIECNCTSISLNHVCTVYSPEQASSYYSKEEALSETRWIECGFKPTKYKMSLTKCEE